MAETEGFQHSGHSNCITCSLISWFCSAIFKIITVHSGESYSYCPTDRKAQYEKRELFKNGWDWGVSVTGAFKLDHLHTDQLILFRKFSNLSQSIVGSLEREESWRWEKGSLYKWMWRMGLRFWGIQYLDQLPPGKLILFHKFHLV